MRREEQAFVMNGKINRKRFLKSNKLRFQTALHYMEGCQHIKMTMLCHSSICTLWCR